jgi:predicted dehydrogenase
MSEKLRIAVIGWKHGWKFIDSLSLRSDYVGGSLAAMCGRTLAGSKPANAPDVPIYADYIKMMDELKPDGIVAALPNDLHVEVTREAAKRGIAVLLEKPIASTLAQAQEIIDIVNETKIPFQVAHHRRFSAKLNLAKEIIESGRLGRIVGANVLWMSRKPDNYFQVKWRVTDKVGGPLLINSIHDVDDLRYTVGEIEAVQAFAGNTIRGFDVEDVGAATIRFKNGALGSYLFSDGTPSKHFYEACAQEDPFFHPVDEDCYFFFGDKAQLSFPSMKITGYNEKSGGADWTRPFSVDTVPVARFNPIDGETKHFCDMIKDRSVKTRCSAEDSTVTLKVIEAIRASARTGKTICIDEFNN